MSEEEFASKVSTETPWWAKGLTASSKATVWLAAGIVGVPSLIAIAAGAFIAHNVAYNLKVLTQYNLSELDSLSDLENNQSARWEAVRRLLAMEVQVDTRICVHDAQTKQQISDCIVTGEQALNLLQGKPMGGPIAKPPPQQ
jgi:hypothetical protein